MSLDEGFQSSLDFIAKQGEKMTNADLAIINKQLARFVAIQERNQMSRILRQNEKEVRGLIQKYFAEIDRHLDTMNIKQLLEVTNLMNVFRIINSENLI